MSQDLDRCLPYVQAFTRRQFIETTATGAFGLLALSHAPVFAQRREVSMLTWNHFVPTSDERLKEIAADFSKRHNVNLRIDTMVHLQLPAKWATEVQTKTGHDLIFTYCDNSPQTIQILDYYQKLYHAIMDSEVLSWDDASNNRRILSGKCAWVHNPVSPYNLALGKQMPIAEDLNHHLTLGGPAGWHFAPPIHQMGI